MEEKRGFSSAVKGASKPCLGKIKTSEEQKYVHPGYGNVTVMEMSQCVSPVPRFTLPLWCLYYLHLCP